MLSVNHPVPAAPRHPTVPVGPPAALLCERVSGRKIDEVAGATVEELLGFDPAARGSARISRMSPFRPPLRLWFGSSRHKEAKSASTAWRQDGPWACSRRRLLDIAGRAPGRGD